MKRTHLLVRTWLAAQHQPLVARVTVDFLDKYLAGQRAAAAAMRRAGRVPGRALLVGGGQLPP